jgi:phage replication O-like protein O
MTHPELDNGYLRIANELAEAFAKLRLAPRRWQVLWAIIRLTYGYNKKADRISLGQLHKLTGIYHRHLSFELGQLVKMNILTKQRGGYINTYGLQKYHDQWQTIPSSGNTQFKEYPELGIPETGNETIPSSGNETIPNSGNHQRQKTKNKPLEKISDEIQNLKSRYLSLKLIDEAINAIASTRKSGKVSDSIILSQLKKWSRYPAEQVEAGINIFIDRNYAGQGKRESYLLGIIRNQPPTQSENAFKEAARPKEINLDEILAN